ncbi:hypothetical protein LPUS_08111 [Lasallia pustulata]|nr:hypothetical protein LPUS_08111 [Lasallia pustulata]
MYASIIKAFLAFSLATTTINAAPTLDARTLPKANEYDSPDCSGPMAYHHHPGWGGLINECVSMNVTTHSVYITSGTLGAGFIAYNKDDCTGDALSPTGTPPYLQGANAGQKCVDLDTCLLPKADQGGSDQVVLGEWRINSVQFIESGLFAGGAPPAS